ncbi:MAG: carboxypeptidase regulatory-like domain-containing protein [Bryobacterales bacterium]|nr:carboxypeptidase regulatory-like domain-containing protein [Bryobacterales bacterium]
MKTGKLLLAALVAGSLLMFTFPAPLLAAKKKKEKAGQAEAAGAVLAGTVFTGAGFALRGATVLVTAVPAEGAPAAKKPARWEAVSDARGEFLFRLPPGPARYNVVVRAGGHQPQEKQLTYAADERQDQNFLLDPAREAAGK